MTKCDPFALSLGVAAMAWKLARPARRPPPAPAQDRAGAPGISVVIPSRQGRHLLERMLPAVEAGLADGEILVIDNGSSDGTEQYLRCEHPSVLVETHSAPLSFARAVNRGARLAQRARLCLLNNDMEIEPGFFRALEAAFDEDPNLFCASAQIFFPHGARREETGKTAMRRPHSLTPNDYPVFCPEPLPGEDFSPVLYGSGGCSLYDREKFLALGGLDEIYEPAYVEDLDLGYRAWLRGWSSMYMAGARVLHRHRATSSRFYSEAELGRLLDRNHVRFLLRAVQSMDTFLPYYRHAMTRLPLTDPAEAFRLASPARIAADRSEREILDLTCGAVRVFPGAKPDGACCLGYCRPGAAPRHDLLEQFHRVILVDGNAGHRVFQAARNELRRRYPRKEIVER